MIKLEMELKMKWNKEKLIEKFTNKNIITNIENLENYINFCIKNNTSKEKYKTAQHHILPKANDCYPEYKNLKNNPWNSVNLLHKHHLEAHYLLLKCISSYSQYSALIAMCNKDTKNERISIKDFGNILNYDEFQEILEKKNKMHSLWLNQMTTNGKTNSENKVLKTLNTINKKYIKNGIITSIANETAKKIALNMKKEYVKDGVTTTARKESTKKMMKTLNNIYFCFDKMKFTTKLIERGLIQSKNKRNKGKWYKVINIFNNELIEIISKQELRNNYPYEMFKKGKDNFLGKTSASKVELNKQNNLHLIGLYVKETIK